VALFSMYCEVGIVVVDVVVVVVVVAVAVVVVTATAIFNLCGNVLFICDLKC